MDLGYIHDFFLHLLNDLLESFLVSWGERSLQDDIMLHHHTARSQSCNVDPLILRDSEINYVHLFCECLIELPELWRRPVLKLFGEILTGHCHSQFHLGRNSLRRRIQLNARNHFLAIQPLVEVGAHTLDPIPGASVLADWDLVLAPISSKAREAFTGFSIPFPFIDTGHWCGW